jgi:CRP-like cAMP-binding protein
MYVERDCSACLIKSTNCFSKLPADDLAYINSFKSSTIVKRNQVIFHEGRLPQGVYCLNEGKIKIYRLGNDGKEQVVRIVTPSGFFGLRALISGWVYSTSAVTLEDSVVCMIPKHPFLKITLKFPEVSHCLMVYLSTMLEDAESKLMSLAQKPIRERLAETLVTLHELFNKNSGDSYINLSRTDIANIIGTANECVIRLLSEFKDENLICTNGRKISILDLEKLKRIARIS